MQTASLVIPSPNTNEKSFGYSSYFITAIAATTSVQTSREHMSKISITVKVNCSYSLHRSLSKDSYLLGMSIVLPEDVHLNDNVGEYRENCELEDSAEEAENEDVLEVLEELLALHVVAGGEDNGR